MKNTISNILTAITLIEITTARYLSSDQIILNKKEASTLLVMTNYKTQSVSLRIVFKNEDIFFFVFF